MLECPSFFGNPHAQVVILPPLVRLVAMSMGQYQFVDSDGSVRAALEDVLMTAHEGSLPVPHEGGEKRMMIAQIIENISQTEGLSNVEALEKLLNCCLPAPVLVPVAQNTNASSLTASPTTPKGDLLHCEKCDVYLTVAQLKKNQCPMCHKKDVQERGHQILNNPNTVLRQPVVQEIIDDEEVPVRLEPVPAQDNRLVGWGKFASKTWMYVAENEMSYVKWVLQNQHRFDKEEAKEFVMYLRTRYLLVKGGKKPDYLIDRVTLMSSEDTPVTKTKGRTTSPTTNDLMQMLLSLLAKTTDK